MYVKGFSATLKAMSVLSTQNEHVLITSADHTVITRLVQHQMQCIVSIVTSGSSDKLHSEVVPYLVIVSYTYLR